MVVGPEGVPGEDTFHITVCTPHTLTFLLDRDGIVVGRHRGDISIDLPAGETVLRVWLPREHVEPQ